MRVAATWLASAGLFVLPACISSSVVDSAGRAVAPANAHLDWQPASEAELPGLYESVSIDGEAALSLWKIYYVFAGDGSYSGAALVLGAANPTFQTLSGSWALADGILDFGEGQTARVSSAIDYLKLESDGGIVLLRRAEMQ